MCIDWHLTSINRRYTKESHPSIIWEWTLFDHSVLHVWGQDRKSMRFYNSNTLQDSLRPFLTHYFVSGLNHGAISIAQKNIKNSTTIQPNSILVRTQTQRYAAAGGLHHRDVIHPQLRNVGSGYEKCVQYDVYSLRTNRASQWLKVH